LFLNLAKSGLSIFLGSPASLAILFCFSDNFLVGVDLISIAGTPDLPVPFLKPILPPFLFFSRRNDFVSLPANSIFLICFLFYFI
jgi:hypothetical protein